MMFTNAELANQAQKLSSDAAYKDAWGNTPIGGAGQFGASGPFAGVTSALPATRTAVQATPPFQSAASQVMQAKPMDAQHRTDESLVAVTNPWAAAVLPGVVAPAAEAAGGAPGRPDIDDTMSQEEPYRRAWQNAGEHF